MHLGRYLLGVGALLLSGFAHEASAQLPPTVPAKDAGKVEKKIAFEMRAKPWAQVFEWLSDQTGLPFISNYPPPTGSFNFINPRIDGKEPRKYSIGEVIDVVNEGLQQYKYVLIRREASLTLFPADEKLPPEHVQTIRAEDLPNRGNTEVVKVVVKLEGLVAEDFAPEVKRIMGNFGDVIILSRPNQLVLQDKVSNLREILKVIRDAEDIDKGQAETYSHKCVYIPAVQAETVLKNLLGDSKQIVEMSRPSGGGNGGNGPGGKDGGQPQRVSKIRLHFVTSDERTNTVHVTGPADKIAQAKAILAKLDVSGPGQQPFIIGEPTLQTYNVTPGSADALAKALTDIHKGSSSLRISAVSPSQLMVYAGPEDQIKIARHIQGTKPAGSKTDLISLNNLDAARVAETVKAMYGSEAKGGAPFIEADPIRNALIVRGTPDQVKEVRSVVEAIGENPSAQGGNVATIMLDKGSAATLAEALQRLIPQMRANPVKVVLPGSDNPFQQPEQQPKLPSKELKPELESNRQEPNRLQPVMFQDGKQPKEGKDKKESAPISIIAFGNKLVVVSEDQEAIALVRELVRLLTQTQPGEGDFEVLRLKNASAIEAAKILDEAFNGPKAGGPGGGRGGPGGGGGGGMPGIGGGGLIGGLVTGALGIGGGGPGQPVRVERIRVVADPATNTLLVKASPLDLLTIRNLLGKALDVGTSDSNAVTKTWMIGPLQNASASEVATVVRDVYRDNLNATSVRTNVAGNPGFAMFPFQGGGGQQNQNPLLQQKAPLSVGVDERTNSIALSCNAMLYEDVRKLIDQLDKSAGDSKQAVKIVSIEGLDPQLVRQALDAIQGKSFGSPRTGNTNPTGGFNGGFNPGGGGNFGGFTPGGAGGFRGGMTPGGGFTPGGGGGIGFPGGGGGFRGGRGPGGRISAGPDFFAPAVTDDHQSSMFFDPAAGARAPAADPLFVQDKGLQLVNFQDIPAPEKEKDQPGVQAPRLGVTVEPLDQLGLLVLRGSPADLEAALRIIEFIRKQAAPADIEIVVVPLRVADATSVVNTLNQLFSRVQVGPNSITQIPGGANRGGFGGQQQQQPQFGQGGGFGQGGFGQGGFGQGGQFGGAQPVAAQQTQQFNSSVVMIPLTRQNAVLIATPKSRVEFLTKEIQKLDVGTAGDSRATPIGLKRAAASRVAQQINTFYANRFTGEGQAQNQIRVTWDDNTNTVFVQAAPADMVEIRSLVDHIDQTWSNAKNDLRIFNLKNALADDLAAIITRAVTDGFTQGQTGGTLPAFGAGVGGQGGGFGQGGGGFGQGGGGLGQGGGFGQGGAGQQGGVVAGTAQGTRVTKVSSLRFISNRKDAKLVETGILEDIHINTDPRTNNIIVAAPPATMLLIEALIRELDVAPNARSEVTIFSLKKADATQLALTLQQLFQGTGGTPRTGAGGGGGGAFGGGNFGGGAVGGGVAGATGGTGRPLQLTLSGATAQGAPLIDLRVTVDERTNSLIVAGSKQDLTVLEAIISRLEDADIQQRRNEAVRLRNAQAADVANALNDFITKSLNVLKTGNQLTNYQEVQRNVVIAAEPITNTLLISATPQYFEDIIRLIAQLDMMPPQVMVQVLVAEVDLTDTNEFGVEFGLQSPVLFQRGIYGTNGTTASITAPTTGTSLLPQGVTVNTTANSIAQPGFNFNNPLIPLGNNATVQPQTVGFQGLNSLGVGRVSPSSNIGGFVFSAAGDSVNLLVRALRIQGRIEVLSRPQVMTLDNQTALINVGQEIPIVTSSNVTATGIVTSNIDRRTVGVILQVTPKITPDGRVLMRVVPEISSVVPTPVDLGNGQIGTALNIQHLETTITAYDGETVALGGLISKRDNRNENKIPWFGDLPYVGAAFRYRTQAKSKTELLVILTPHIVRSRADAEKLLSDEARKMDWTLPDVLKMHGNNSLDRPFMNFNAPPGGGPIELAPPEAGPSPRLMPEGGPSSRIEPFKTEAPNGVKVNRMTPEKAVPPTNISMAPRQNPFEGVVVKQARPEPQLVDQPATRGAMLIEPAEGNPPIQPIPNFTPPTPISVPTYEVPRQQNR